jgi:UDP-glucose 4-epimerase
MAVLGDPQSFPITADQPRDLLSWYGRTKTIGEESIKTFADGALPAHLLLKSNLYGEHVVDDTIISKPTVINFFIDRALSGEILTVYEPGTQARNFVHVKDVAKAYVRSVEQLLKQVSREEPGVVTYGIAGKEDMSVIEVAQIVQETAQTQGLDVEIEYTNNPRSDETLVEQFPVDTSRAKNQLSWERSQIVSGSVRNLFTQQL